MADPACPFVIERFDPLGGTLPSTYVCSRWPSQGEPGACLACSSCVCSVYLREEKASLTESSRND